MQLSCIQDTRYESNLQPCYMPTPLLFPTFSGMYPSCTNAIMKDRIFAYAASGVSSDLAISNLRALKASTFNDASMFLRCTTIWLLSCQAYVLGTHSPNCKTILREDFVPNANYASGSANRRRRNALGWFRRFEPFCQS